MSDSGERKGPVAIGLAVIAAAGLAFKAGCAKMAAVGGDDAARAIGAASHGGSSVVDDAAHTGAMTVPVEEGVGDAAKSVGKEAVQTLGPDAAEAAYEAAKERKNRKDDTETAKPGIAPMAVASPTPAPTPVPRPYVEGQSVEGRTGRRTQP